MSGLSTRLDEENLSLFLLVDFFLKKLLFCFLSIFLRKIFQWTRFREYYYGTKTWFIMSHKCINFIFYLLCDIKID